MRPPLKIPTLVGLVLVVGLVLIVGFFFEGITRQATKASGSIVPTAVETTNISDIGFTLSWTTESPATGALIVQSQKQPKQTLFDERDITGKLGKYVTHSVSVRSAQPASEYEVRLLSDGKLFLDGGSSYRIRTAPALSQSGNALEPAFGSVLTASGQPAQGALVYLTLEGGQKLSTLVKTSGSWLVPLNLTRTADFSQLIIPQERMTETILVRFGTEEASALTDTLNDAPVPAMTLGKSYDFRRQQAKQPTSAVASVSQPSVLGQSSQSPLGTNQITITKPANGAALPTALPIFQGTGIAGKSVAITIGITNPIGGTTMVGPDGLWSYVPPAPLAPGKQSVTITTQDKNNKTVALTNTFEILKSGTQVLGDATPSATLTLTPTLTPTLAATPTPTATLAAQPPPTSGNELPMILLLILGFGFLGGGAVLFAK